MGILQARILEWVAMPPPGDLANPRIEPRSPTLPADSLPSKAPGIRDQIRSVIQSCPTLCDPMDYSSPGSSVHGDSPGKNIGVGCHALLQGIFPNQGLDPSLLHVLHWRWILFFFFFSGFMLLLPQTKCAHELSIHFPLCAVLKVDSLPTWESHLGRP